MTDRIEKALRKLTAKERLKLKGLLALILAGEISGLDVKKLKGRDDIYRVRKGALRIIFLMRPGRIRILAVERRAETTYNEF